MGVMQLPWGSDADVHLSSDEVIDQIKRRNPSHYQNGFIGVAEEYIEQEMAPLGLESAWIWLNPHGSLFETELYEKENRHIYGLSKKYAQFRPFGWLSFFRHEDHTDRQHRMRQFYEEYGFHGLKINIEDTTYTRHTDFRLTVECLGAELDFLSKHYPQKLILFHTGINVEGEKAHPRLIGDLAANYRDLNFVMVHTGGCPGAIVKDYHLEAIAVMSANPNVYGILSMINPASVFDIYRSIARGEIAINQVMVGSDYPYNKAIGTIDSRFNLACHPELEFSEDQIKMIMTGNAKALTQG